MPAELWNNKWKTLKAAWDINDSHCFWQFDIVAQTLLIKKTCSMDFYTVKYQLGFKCHIEETHGMIKTLYSSQSKNKNPCFLCCCCTLQASTPYYLPSTLTTATWTVGWLEAQAPRCPTFSKSPRRASAACGRSPPRAWAACWGRSAPPRPWFPASVPEWVELQTRCRCCHGAPLLVMYLGHSLWATP